MNPRVRLVIIGALAAGFATLGAVWVVALTSGDEPVPAGFSGGQLPPGARVPDFALTDERGDPVSPGEEAAIYVFVYSTCQDTCPVMTQQVRAALDDLGRDVPVYGISVDPANDTERRAQAFLAEQYMTGRMRFVLGSEAELEPIWSAFGVAPQREGREHSARVVIADGDGRQRVGYFAAQLTPEALASDLRKLS